MQMPETVAHRYILCMVLVAAVHSASVTNTTFRTQRQYHSLTSPMPSMTSTVSVQSHTARQRGSSPDSVDHLPSALISSQPLRRYNSFSYYPTDVRARRHKSSSWRGMRTLRSRSLRRNGTTRSFVVQEIAKAVQALLLSNNTNRTNNNDIPIETIQRLLESKSHAMSQPRALRSPGLTPLRIPRLTPTYSLLTPNYSTQHREFNFNPLMAADGASITRSRYYSVVDQYVDYGYQYRWLIVAIVCVVMLLLIVTCINLYRFRIKRKRKAIETNMNIKIHHDKKKRTNKRIKIEIETTLSDQAPCKRWMLCDTIGSGRFGRVHLAIDPQVHPDKPSKCYAVKRARFFRTGIHGFPVSSSEVFSIFDEILVLSKVQHANIVKYYGNAVASEHICLFLEWCPCGSMSDVLTRGKAFSVARIHGYLSQLLSALDYLHSMAIYHRDIKARNVLLCSGGVCKLADFGSCVDLSQKKQTTTTQQVSVAGTLHWCPPECFLTHEESIDALGAHDVWNLGVTLIEMILIHPLFDELSVEVFSVMMKTSPQQYLQRLPVTTDPHLNMFLRFCLTIPTKQRPSVQQLQKHPFITNNYSVSDEETSALLSSREEKARKYAISIIHSNLKFWNSTIGDSPGGTKSISELGHKCILDGSMPSFKYGIDAERYR